MIKKYKLFFYAPVIALMMLFLGGCKLVVLDSKGLIGEHERNLIIIATLLMLIVVIPVIVLTAVFTYKYRSSNTSTYSPDWCHSNKIEFVMWFIPIVIIGILAAITWVTTHQLDPYKPLVSDEKPVEVNVVALDWKWLFIYPEERIATVNYLRIPVNRPINFKLTADAPMNSFMIPQLGGQIYAMTGMQTKLHLLANEKGIYDGRGVSFTGEGFSGMQFNTEVTSTESFNDWVQQVKANPSYGKLNVAEYNTLSKPSVNDPVAYYSSVRKGLFQDVINKFMMPKMRDENNNLVIMKAPATK